MFETLIFGCRSVKQTLTVITVLSRTLRVWIAVLTLSLEAVQKRMIRSISAFPSPAFSLFTLRSLRTMGAFRLAKALFPRSCRIKDTLSAPAFLGSAVIIGAAVITFGLEAVQKRMERSVGTLSSPAFALFTLGPFWAMGTFGLAKAFFTRSRCIEDALPAPALVSAAIVVIRTMLTLCLLVISDMGRRRRMNREVRTRVVDGAMRSRVMRARNMRAFDIRTSVETITTSEGCCN